MDNLVKIVKIHGATIKRLGLSNNLVSSEFEAKDITEFLQNLPNLVEWSIYGSSSFFSDITGNCEPVLFNLKKFDFCCFGLSDLIFEKLSSFVASNTVEYLDLGMDINYEKFILRQRNIKFLECYDKYLPQHLNAIKSLNLEEFECYEYGGIPGDIQLLELIREQKKLRKINFTETKVEISATVVEAICQHSHYLQTLGLELSDNNVASLFGINQLKELQKLEITFAENFTRVDLLIELTRLEMQSIKKVEFFCLYDVNFQFDSILEALGVHWRNIEEIIIDFNLQSINSILENLKSLKTLTLYHTTPPRFEYDSCIYPLLERLTIFNHVSISTFDLDVYLLEALPNLNYFNLQLACDFKGALQLEALAKMPKLKHLEISFNVTRTKINPTSRDVSAIKKLCGTLKTFEIIFITANDSNFTRDLAALLEEQDYIKQEISAKYGHQSKALVLKNFLY